MFEAMRSKFFQITHNILQKYLNMTIALDCFPVKERYSLVIINFSFLYFFKPILDIGLNTLNLYLSIQFT